ncbi:stress-response A/B barrel domain-containing protein At5g22580-like [Benincasa hispida]|uniref:stress-response A/B barrel domain-containing protein At5g22580-like n=1 Tax=Benincasa hispida TaxID=102211 RepID=UPI0018FFB703|nr:stress-response A/B barrel domain-containing protein At5g22580-like [Benincasa hispida]XP_038893881.1 stress-response A/B barrel domain-containing protein At5g22580-like [Benincasa hispida]
MAEFKHLVVVKFKEGVNVDEIVEQVEKMVSVIDSVKSFEWGHDVEGQDMLTQGFTHVFSMTFDDKEAITSFLTHPKHIEFCPTFSAAIDKIVVLDFPSLLVKAPAPPPSSPPLPPPPAVEAIPEAAPPPVLTSTPLPTPATAPAPTPASASA